MPKKRKKEREGVVTANNVWNTIKKQKQNQQQAVEYRIILLWWGFQLFFCFVYNALFSSSFVVVRYISSPLLRQWVKETEDPINQLENLRWMFKEIFRFSSSKLDSVCAYTSIYLFFIISPEMFLHFSMIFILFLFLLFFF